MITIDGTPVVMPMMLFEQADPTHLRTYYEKRDLVDRAQKYQLVDFDDQEWVPLITEYTKRMAEEYRPFDYGRFEFRLDRDANSVQFLEVNLQANLWSEKVFGRSAVRAGFTQSQLVETILYEGLSRHGLLAANCEQRRFIADPGRMPVSERLHADGRPIRGRDRRIMTKPELTVIVLAAQRGGRLDPLAAEAGVSHKCLVPIGGRPLLAHVLEALDRGRRPHPHPHLGRTRRRR